METGPIVITGASGGLGLALTEYLFERGYRNLICQYRSSPDRLRALFERFGQDASNRVLHADLTVEQDVVRLRETVEAAHGTPYALVCLAGGSSNGMSWKLSVDEFHRIVDQNLLSTFLVNREFAAGMRKAERGRIVNTSSVVAFKGVSGAAHYCAAKAAIVGWSKALALELAPKSVVVSAIALGYFEVGLIEQIPEPVRGEIAAGIPARRFGSAKDLGGLIEFLLGEGGAYSGGQVYHLNGGLYS